MDAFLLLALGAVIGWLGSLAFRTDTQGGILLDIAAGMFGAILVAVLFGSDYRFDILLAGALGAMLAIALLAGTRRLSRLRRSRTNR